MEELTQLLLSPPDDTERKDTLETERTLPLLKILELLLQLCNDKYLDLLDKINSVLFLLDVENDGFTIQLKSSIEPEIKSRILIMVDKKIDLLVLNKIFSPVYSIF
ncbi:MAG: hypothetical protein AMR96_05725 [Candidatus Adiutrix intracellularis]|nr:MAG: hypothetical protein AMR96_05725 [Candidatus Adiutrix intracellularis]